MSDIKTVVGIDPSLTGFALCVGTSVDQFHVDRFTSKPLGKSVAGRMTRNEDLIARATGWLYSVAISVDLIVIEGYAHNSHQGVTLAEFGGLLRYFLCDLTESIHEVAPSTMRKFVTGKGNGDKTLLVATLAKKYEQNWDNNDQYDAFGLYLMALGMVDQLDGMTVAQRDAIATIKAKGE